jgi:prepilin-type N-terminal cleavage/methylation domain-containing protein
VTISKGPSKPVSRQRGFTLVELLVVIAIIGILISIMLPAVQAAREAGRRATCSNNLLRLAMATNSYESSHGYYPPGVVDLKGPILSQAVGMHHGWIERLLPYLDERAAHSKIDFAASVYDPKNAAVRNLALVELLCPSDEVVEEATHSSYAACQNDTESPIDADNHGVFFLNSKLRSDDITDGLGYTLFIAEKRSGGTGTDLGWMSGTRATLRNTGTELNATGPRGTPSSPANPAAPDQKQPPIWESPAYVGGFGSDHSGCLVVAAFGDGSVHYLSDTIDSSILKLLGNRADGELINPTDLDK